MGEVHHFLQWQIACDVMLFLAGTAIYLPISLLYLQGGQQTLDFLCPWKNTLENPEITFHPRKVMS